jgi:agmatinase
VPNSGNHLSYISLHVSQPNVFSGRTCPYDEAVYVVVGVPYDRSSTYRPGSRFGPSAIREASANIETYSMRTGIDIEDLRICDAGDVNVTESPLETMERIRSVIHQIASDGKIPVMLGGEHTVSFGAVRAFRDIDVVSFDAHMDLRNEYNGDPLSHASVMRRISEHVGPERIVLVGTRAVCKEELEFSRTKQVAIVPSLDLHEDAVDDACSPVKKTLDGRQKLYVTLDMDVLDPAFAPAVGNPEPDGLTPKTLVSLLEEVCKRKVVAIDLTEVTPHYDTGATAVQAAKLLFESLCYVEARQRNVRSVSSR